MVIVFHAIDNACYLFITLYLVAFIMKKCSALNTKRWFYKEYSESNPHGYIFMALDVNERRHTKSCSLDRGLYTRSYCGQTMKNKFINL